MNLEAVLSRLQGVRRNGSGWQALCPAHADKTHVYLYGDMNCMTLRAALWADTAKEKLNLCGTTGGSAAEKWLDEYTASLTGKNCVVVPDADDPGRKKARSIAQALSGNAAFVCLLELPGAKDLTEWVEKGGTPDKLLGLISTTGAYKPEAPVDGARLLDNVAAYIRRFVSLSDSQARVAAAFVVHTHKFDAADSTPYLAVTSAEKSRASHGCSKCSNWLPQIRGSQGK